MGGSYEKNIRWKTIGVYLFIAAVCIAASLYIYNLGRNVRGQKEHIENYYELLRMTNRVVFSVSDAQSTANLYLTSKSPTHLRNFRQKIAGTEELLDSLSVLSHIMGDTSQIGSLNEISGLLRRKGDIIHQLNTRLSSYNPVDSIAQKLLVSQAPLIIKDSVLITTIVSDTVIHMTEKKNFWDRVSNVFTPDHYRDSIMTVQRIRTDTIRNVMEDSLKLAPQARRYVEEIRTGYSSNLRAVEQQINRLLANDQEISEQIIDILNSFHRSTIQSTIRHIEQSEEAIQRNYRYSFTGILLSLLLITLFVVLIINDTNKGQSSRIALEKANRRIRDIMASRHKLLLSVSHDVKTPLGSILGYLELWKQDHDPRAEDIASAELSAKHINALIGNLLEFSSLEQGLSRPSPSVFALGDFCRETAAMIRPMALGKGLELRTSFQFPDELTVMGDVMRMRQIMLNLLSNAVKYTAEGSVVFEVSYKDTRVTARIKDTGSGMDADELARIFKPFSRLDSNRAMAEGHGFGMYVVHGLVELLDGTISVESTPGKGTSVSVGIPAPMSGMKTREGARSILFIDDDRILLGILQGLAGSLGHNAITTSDPEAVISGRTDVSGFDMIITDMEMGRCQGTDVLAAVRERHPLVPVIVMTGHHDFTADRAARLGFDGYLPKPVSGSSLESIMGRATGAGARRDDTSASCDSLLGDGEAMREIMDTFVVAIRDDLRVLRGALFRRDRRKVREICHRMLPLMLQFGAGDCADLLAKIDAAAKAPETDRELWQDLNQFIEECGKFIDSLDAGSASAQ